MATIAMTPDQFAELMKAIGHGGGGGDNGPRNGGSRINSKAFSRVTKFSKGEEEWKEWTFDFTVTLGSQSPDMVETLKVVESFTEETSTAKVEELDEPRAEKINLKRLSRELFEVLVATTDGEAKMMIRNVPDQDGVLAWQRLYRHHNRRALARVLRIHREAMHPKPATDISQVISSVMEWEDKWTRMAKEYPSVPVLWKMAALMELCPADVQDMVYQNIDDVHEDYGRLREKIFSWVPNKVAAKGGPTPMDIGRVERHDHETEYYDVDAIGSSMQCCNCSGWGHASRECPSQKTAKGGGKAGDKGKERGKGKDWGSPKGYGKGYGGKGAEENQKGKRKRLSGHVLQLWEDGP